MMQQPQPGQQQPAQQASMDPQQHYQQWMWAQQQQPPPQPQQQHMWPQQQQQQNYQQQPQPQQQQQYQQQAGGADEVRTLWIGDLQYWMDEGYITSCFPQSELVTVKIIRNKQTMQSEGYGFVEFASHAGAERVLQTYNGTLMPNAETSFRLNWASHGSGEKRSDDTPDHTIFVGDLAPEITDYTLQETFKAHYPSVKGAKVVMDKQTGRAKGYGFVRFADESEQLRAMSEMNGVICAGRAMRIGAAASKKTVGGAASYQSTQGTQNDSDPNNTTLFVGNLDSNVSDEHLRQAFSQYGELVHVKIPVGKQCGFVQFTTRACAEEALRAMDGAQLGGRNVRLSWGHNTSNRRPQAAEQNQWNNTPYYGYPQGYNSYGYGAPQDPNMYYGGYPGYGGYAVPQPGQQPVQQQQ